MATIFVTPDSDEEISENLRKAWHVLEKNNLTPKWFDQKECLDINERVKMAFYVCDPFSGPAFEHLKNMKCRILGPLCILHSIERTQPIPNLPYPVFNSPMNKVLACCTNITVENRRKLFSKIELMGGRTSGTFTEKITHLIADEVGSKKYHVAAKFKTPVMMCDWVWECWEISQKKNILATESMFDKFRCPIFKGLIITVTQFEAEERKEIQNAIEQHGGVYSGDLCLNKTTHLIALNCQGQKYKFARQWKVNCINSKWLHDSVKAGYALDETLYKLEMTNEPIVTTSSPQKKTSNARDLKLLSTSAISATSPVANVNETVASLEGSFLKPTNINKSSTSSLDGLAMHVVYNAGNFLDGCKIFLMGFDNNEVEKLRRVINSGGGTRLNQMSESVSHCIMKEKCEELFQYIQENQLRPHVVSIDWLVDSCHAGYVIDETVYSLWDNVSLLTSPNKDNSVIKNAVQDITEVENLPAPGEDEVLSQYLGIESQTMLDDNDIFAQLADEVESNDINKSSVKQPDVSRKNEDLLENDLDERGDEDIQMVQDLDEVDDDGERNENGVFKNLRFLMVDFNDDNLELVIELIKENGGKVTSDTSKQKSDYVVVPLARATSDFLTGKVVTSVWLQACVDKSKIVSRTDDSVFTPVYCNLDSKPLQGCILSLSQFTGVERKSLIELAETLGAKCQEYFVRRTVTDKGLFASTHLLCSEPSGSKYLGAIKWKLPVVDKKWLVDCAQNDCRMPEKNYLIENTPCSSTLSGSGQVENEKRLTPKKTLSFNDTTRSNSNIINSTSNPANENSSASVSPLAAESSVTTPITVKRKKRSIEQSIDSMRQIFTPLLKPRVNRIQEIMDQECNSRPTTPDSDGAVTPSKFLGPNQKYVPKLQFPTTPDVIIKKKPSRESIDEVQDLFSHRIKAAVDNTKSSGPFGRMKKLSSSSSLEDSPIAVKTNGPFHDVVVCVSRKLNHHQSELKKMVVSLGGECRWIFDDTCTHFVYQGKPSGNCEDYKLAKQLKKKIVAPDWIKACYEQKKLVNESRYPPTFNPNMSLDITIEKTPRSLSEEKKIATSAKSVGNPYIAELDDTFEDNEDSVDKSTEPNPSIVSNEVRDSLNRQMEEMLARKSEIKSKPKRRKTSSSNFSEDESMESITPVKKSNEVSIQKIGEPSQVLGVTWGDATDKEEMDRIAAMLAKESQAINLKLNFEKDIEDKEMDEIEEKEAEIKESNGSDKENENGASRTVSPFKLAENKVRRKNLRIMLSGFTNEERVDYAALIEELGGIVSDSQAFDKASTHLVANTPSRNEKYLASMAMGKWILHKSYFEECRQEKRFVDEEIHEWGSDSTKSIIAKMQPHVAELAATSRQWRLKLQHNKHAPRVFSGWKCILYTESTRESSFRRLLEAGDAVISKSIYPFSNPQGATHAFIELMRVEEKKVDFAALLEANVFCIRFEFISAFITDAKTASVKNYYIPEAVEIIKTREVERELQQSKRKPTEENSPNKKRKNC